LPTKDTPTFSCSRLRIEMDCTVAGSWCEIDAVAIVCLHYPYIHSLLTLQ